MRKFALLIVTFLMLCGCSTEYNIKIENDKIVEEIKTSIPKSLYPDYSNINPDAMISDDDQLTPFIKGDQYAFGNNKYKKDVVEDNERYYVNLKYEYTPDEFKEGKVISSCFENVTYDYQGDYYLINLSGQFFCLYGDELVINLSTPNIVEEHNADSVNGSKYVWKINKDNVQDTNISIKISKESKMEKYIMIGVIVGAIIILVGGALVISKIMSNKEKLNEV